MGSLASLDSVEHGSAELPMAKESWRLALSALAEYLLRQRRVEDAKRTVDAFEVGAELNDPSLRLAQLTIEFGALIAKGGDHMRFGHGPWNVGPGRLNRLWQVRQDTVEI